MDASQFEVLTVDDVVMSVTGIEAIAAAGFARRPERVSQTPPVKSWLRPTAEPPFGGWAPEEWVHELARNGGERRFRLLLVGACRYLCHPPQGYMRQEAEDGLRALEHFIDSGDNESAVRNAHRKFRGTWIDTRRPWRNPPDYRALEKTLSIENEMEAVVEIVQGIAKRHGISTNEAERELAALASDLDQPKECSDWKDIWRTHEITELARAMYDSRDFRQIFQLADLLQQAGCHDEIILHHCRNPLHVHIRGCWVIDAILSHGGDD